MSEFGGWIGSAITFFLVAGLVAAVALGIPAIYFLSQHLTLIWKW